jgi:integrase/recombinase XerD
MGNPSKCIIYTQLYQSEAKEFYDYLKVIGYHAKSCRAKYRHLTEFFSFMESRSIFDLQAIAPCDVTAFYRYLQSRESRRDGGRRLSERFVCRFMRCVQTYFGYALDRGKISVHPASHLRMRDRRSQSVRRVFTQEEIRELYRAAQTLQERAILHIAYGCGLRVSEISDLNVEDIRPAEKMVVVRCGKMGKRRLIPVNDRISADLQAFIFSDERKNELADSGRNADTAAYLFYDRTGERMQKWTLNKRLKEMLGRTAFGKCLTKEELVKIGVHTLRHSIASHLLENGMKTEQVRQFLGHSHIETTEIYTHVRQHQIRQLIIENGHN